MLPKIGVCFLLVLTPTFCAESCEKRNEAILSQISSEVNFLEQGLVELLSSTKEMMWTAMRMEMRLNLLKKEMESIRGTYATAPSVGSTSETSSGPSSLPYSPSGSLSTSNHCSLGQLLQDQFKDVPIEITINPPKDNTAVKPTETSVANSEAPQTAGFSRVSSCSQASKTGIYRLELNENNTALVLCDADFDRGGWVVIQYRFNGSEEFFRNWTDYENGFGPLSGEFWIGNKLIYKLTAEKPREIAFLMDDFDNVKAVARYNAFQLGNASEKYSLKSLGLFSGNAGDSLSRNVGSQFSTPDMDNDKSSHHCAQLYLGGWWYDNCHLSNLNGKYMKGATTDYAKSMCWSSFKGFHYSLQTSRIMVRF